ncbi:MAG: GntR family transcriptional regulator, partial [Clostridia bacterium]|nr:GntR family transcriptional regulator [Clostridia bacterium]
MRDHNSISENPRSLSPPKYEQLRRHIIDEIQSGRIQIDTKLASEEELALRFGISRGTVRRAIQTLARDGFVEVVHGRGTIVRRRTAIVSGSRVTILFLDTLSAFRPARMNLITDLSRELRRHSLIVHLAAISHAEFSDDSERLLTSCGEACVVVDDIPADVRLLLRKYTVPRVFVGSAATNEISEDVSDSAIMIDHLRGVK